ncbi:MAG: transcriptional regulator [Nisaea sp.]|jgi:Lrp/AsnC family transcriptional regulator|nr:transcriptional regulator [Nisaea sp.]OUX98691.1 MAG: transcriptional regulator [Candidatus Endolissoclinum sp. TMED26]|tara:strand:- start:89 stop:538 length:450 start_codon:yes stop_codon:yes gene_type:complete
MDDTDRQILRVLQENSGQSISDIARQVGLSSSPCWKRVNRLQADGVIQKQVAILDPVTLGFGLTVFVSIESGDHSSDWLLSFAALLAEKPEVQEFHRMAGDVDYLLKVVVPDMAAYDLFYKELVAQAALTKVTSRFSMETIKSTTALPL